MLVVFDLVIFDCDGVLVDSETIALELDVEMLAEFGIPLTRGEIIDRFLGRSNTDVEAMIVELAERELPDDWVRHWNDRYDELLDTRLTPIPGIVDTLARLTVPICVASSGRPESIERKLALCRLAGAFGDRVFSAVQVTHGKPAPDLFLLAAKRCGADPERCAVVEDSPAGVQAGRAAGMTVFAYAGGMVARERLQADGAVVFDDMRRLPELLAATDQPVRTPLR